MMQMSIITHLALEQLQHYAAIKYIFKSIICKYKNDLVK